MNPTESRRSHAVCWILILLLGFFLLASVVLNGVLAIGLAAGLGSKTSAHRAADEYPDLAETWSYGSGDVKAARIPVVGFIGREVEDGLFMPAFDKVEMILRQIRAAQNDDEVMAIILEVDSPGGVMTPTDEIYEALMRFKDSSPDRKIIVYMKDLAASGGYLVSMPGDWLIAQPTSLIGSIGVIMQTLNIKGMGEKIGVKDTTIKSGANKDLLNPFRDATPEELAILQEVTDSLYHYFFDIVLEGRGMEPEQLTPWADGRVFTSQVALENNLIDEIGYWDEVVARTRELLGTADVKIVRYEDAVGFLGWMTRIRMPLDPASWMGRQAPRFMYLWRP